MPQSTCGTYLAHLLEAYGVEHAFGIPGVHNAELYRGFWQTRIRHISPRHEQGAGFMADGYARTSGKPGVAIVITGPGLTNITTAVGQAYGDSVPMLLISSVNRRHEMGLGKGLLHEMQNQRNLAAGVTAFAHTLQRPDELPEVLAAAFAVFNSARPRPVNIEIPIDIIEQKLEFDPAALRAVSTSRPAADPQSLDEAAGILKAARRVVLIAGGGAAGSGERVRRLADVLRAPVLLTCNGRGLLPPEHPLLADFAVAYEAGREELESAQVILAVGTELGETDFDFYAPTPFRPKVPLIRIDIDPRMIAVGPAPALGIVADASLALDGILDRVGAIPTTKRDQAWAASLVKRYAELSQRTREPEDQLFDAMLATIRDRMREPIIVGDSTKPIYRAMLTYRAPAPRSFMSASTGYGTLGYALPAAIGAKIAAPDRPVVALAGDGGVQFTLPELMSAREAKAGVVLIVWNNDGYGEIRDFMVQKEIKPMAVDVAPPDFLKSAAAAGVAAKRIDSLAELGEALAAIPADATEPMLLETGPWMKG